MRGLFFFLPLAYGLQHAWIDYSAANEYVQAHYHKPYFPVDGAHEPIFNARDKTDATLTGNAFAVVHQPTVCRDFSNLTEVREVYLPELETAIRQAYSDRPILAIVYWHAVLRSMALDQVRPEDATRTPTSNFVTTAHIDVDVHAYRSTSDLVDLIEKNALADLDRE